MYLKNKLSLAYNLRPIKKKEASLFHKIEGHFIKEIIGFPKVDYSKLLLKTVHYHNLI